MNKADYFNSLSEFQINMDNTDSWCFSYEPEDRLGEIRASIDRIIPFTKLRMQS